MDCTVNGSHNVKSDTPSGLHVALLKDTVEAHNALQNREEKKHAAQLNHKENTRLCGE